MAYDMEVCMEQRCVIQFLQAEKMAPIDIHQHLLNIYGDQTMDVSTVRWWVVYFSSGLQHWVTSTAADFYECSTQALINHW